jgi:DNA replication protein DnaC
MNTTEQLTEGLKRLLLPAMKKSFSELAEKAIKEEWSHEEYLLELVQQEVATRENKRFERWLNEVDPVG